MAPIEIEHPQSPDVVALYCDQSPDRQPAATRRGFGRCSIFRGRPGSMKTVVKAEAQRAGWSISRIQLFDGATPTGNYIEKVLCPVHASGRTQCTHTPKHLTWQAQDGAVAICKMEDSHLTNAIAFLAGHNDQDAKKAAEAKKRIDERSPWLLQMRVEKNKRDGNVEAEEFMHERHETYSQSDGHSYTAFKWSGEFDGKPMYTLVIDLDTARALEGVLAHVGGSPTRTDRGKMMGLLNLLRSGIKKDLWLGHFGPYNSELLEGTVHFKDPKQVEEEGRRYGIRLAAQAGHDFVREPDGAFHDWYEDSF